MALDKTKKRGARATIFVFDILDPKDKELLYHWLESDLLAWVHIAPVCGTCSRARQIRNGGPRPLRSDEFPMGLPDLLPGECQRVDLANSMYIESCALFQFCANRGILVTMENPSNSLFWLTEPFVELQHATTLYHSDSQMCMMGGTRPKWTRLVANFSAIDELNVECDGSHRHQPWGKAKDSQGQEVYATSLEAEYPRRFCIALVQCILRQLQRQGMTLMPDALFDVKDNKLFEMQTARIASFNQPRKNKLPPLIPESFAVGVFYVKHASDVPLALHSKSTKPLEVFTKTGELATIPKHARFLCRTATTSPFPIGGGYNKAMHVLKLHLDCRGLTATLFQGLLNWGILPISAGRCRMIYRVQLIFRLATVLKRLHNIVWTGANGGFTGRPSLGLLRKKRLEADIQQLQRNA